MVLLTGFSGFPAMLANRAGMLKANQVKKKR
jgi:hypothetical protein